MAHPLAIQQGIQTQSPRESIAYTVTTTNWASSPTSPVVTAYTEDPWEDVTSTVYPTNSPSVSGDVITLSVLTALTLGMTYRIYVQFTVTTNTYETFFRVKCE